MNLPGSAGVPAGTNFHPGGMADISRGQSRLSGCSPRIGANKIPRSEGAPEMEPEYFRK